MYNRYIRNDAGQYERTSVDTGYGRKEQEYYSDPSHQDSTATQHRDRGKNGILSSLLGRLKLDEIDTGDLLLLLILFLLFREGEDDELLIALGLLLIL